MQHAGRCGGGVPKPRLQDGDGADGRTGWPAVSGAAVSRTPVKASAAGARTGRKAVSLTPQDGQRGWLSESGAVTGR